MSDQKSKQKYNPMLFGKQFQCVLMRLFSQLFVLVILFGLFSQYSYASPKHDQLKAVYLLNILKFIKWSEEQSEQLTFCYIDDSGLKKYLNGFSGKLIKGVKLNVRELTVISELSECHAVYLSETGIVDPSEIIRQSRAFGIVDIGEGASYTEAGGVISLHIVSNKLRFNINFHEAELRKIRLSANLLDLAHLVIR